MNSDNSSDCQLYSNVNNRLTFLPGSSHNWNTLFLSQNAVAQIVAEKYGVSREDFLLEKDDEKDRKQSSIAVRMALAESEIVDETQHFLTSNGVSLEAFEVWKHNLHKTQQY